MQAAYKLDTSSFPAHHEKSLKGKIFPDERVSLPVQEFLSGERAGDIIDQKLATIKGNNDGLQSRFVSYLLNSVSRNPGMDIVDRLQNIHIRKTIAALTKIRTEGLLWDHSWKDLKITVNKEINLSKEILAELEPFLLTIMNTKYIPLTVSDPFWQLSSRSRNIALHELKHRFLDTFGAQSVLPEATRHLFVDQLRKAHEQIHKNHPVHGFLGTILYEITKNPLYFHQPSPWFGFGADIDADFLSKMPTENRENRFWFAKVTAPNVHKHINFRDNTLFFVVCTDSLHAIDGVNFFSENVKKSVTLADNAGSFSYYENALSHAETIKASFGHIDSIKEMRDEWYWPGSYSYAADSFAKSKLSGGLRFGEYSGCFFMSQWNRLDARTVKEHALHGSICIGSGKKSFVSPRSYVSPRALTEGSFDYATIISGLEGTIVQDSLRNAILISNDEGDCVGKRVIVPADSTKDKQVKGKDIPRKSLEDQWEHQEKERNTAFKDTLIIWETSLTYLRAENGFEDAIFLYSGNNATFLWHSAQGTAWYNAGLNTRVGGNAGQGAKIGGTSFCWEKTEFMGGAFYGAQMWGVIGQQANFSEYPFESSLRIENSDMFNHVLSILKQKIRIFLKNVGSEVVAQNDTIENAILEISFLNSKGQGVTRTEDVFIRKRLNILLSSSFTESDKQALIREDTDADIETGKTELVVTANKKRDEMEWDEKVEDLLSKQHEAINELYKFRAERNLMNINNWILDYGNSGDFGISPELAARVIQQIQSAISDAKKTIPEVSKITVLSELVELYFQIKSSAVKPESWSALNVDQLSWVSPDFIEYELPKFIGERAATRIHEALFPKKTGLTGFMWL